MRISHHDQLQLDATPITEIMLDVQCRDPLIPILRGLQHLYSQPQIREQALQLVADDVLGDADPNQGRQCLTLWQIFVLSATRLVANLTYDHLQYLSGNDRNLRALFQVGDWNQERFNWRRIRDNVCRVRPETIEKINRLVVADAVGFICHWKVLALVLDFYILGASRLRRTSDHSNLSLCNASQSCSSFRNTNARKLQNTCPRIVSS